MYEYLDKIVRFQDLSEAEMMDLTKNLFSGQYSEGQITAFLMGLKMKGETVDEVTGFARVMASCANNVPTSVTDAMDNCGTGGDKSGTFNISTTAAFVLAGGGINVAKHGSRSVSSKSGSADVLEELGINLSLSPEKLGKVLEDIGIVFLFAEALHPKLEEVLPACIELGMPTVVNLAGTLINPVKIDTQLLGTSRSDFIEQSAKILRNLGRRRALVITGENNMDEASLFGINRYALLENGEVSLGEFTASDVGMEEVTLQDIQAGDVKENAKIILDVLEGNPSPYLETTILNAGLGFFANGKVDSIKEGCELAREVIMSGKALKKLRLLQEKQV
ncbi:anthranilate phosphoribosyltransferase [Floricoccus penangensis]|uniref:anthranilate phosphoribosyltransferase n=1 Tax=Floricoccus penangensis TaxID=1859475 RepID=UPI002040F599|nr:anthranilate phosphoribosyltransferase [Floricoccus penangensis]URZ88055.1 anthranilate phosphoribosyltransferase [Floricoccus penangensis]